MNRTVKTLVERIAVDSGVVRLGRRWRRDQTLVLAYHNVLPEGEVRAGDVSLHLPLADFRRQLDAISETHDVVPITALGEPPPPSPRRPRIVITFDDAYAGALTCGVDELVKRRMPATVFVAPGLLGSVAWWDVLADRTRGVIPEDVRAKALHTLGGSTRAILAATASQPAFRVTSTTLSRIATEAQVTAAAAGPGITLGSHTWSHPNLASLDDTALDAELLRPREWLESRTGRAVPWLTYPYGMFSAAVQAAAERAGYRGALRIDGGWTRGTSDPPYAIPRLNVPAGISINGFRLRLAGL